MHSMVARVRAGDLDWDDLRHFLRAAHAGTLAGAAREMNVKHSTVGRRLSALERSLGAALVLRGPEGLTLTPLGARLVPLAEEIERAVRAVCEAAAGQRTRVRLAVPSGFTPLFAGPLADFCRRHEGIELELVSGARPVDLKKGEADLAIRSGPCADAELVARKLGDSGFSLYATDGYLARRPGPVDPDDLRGHELIGFDASLAAVPAARWIEEHAAGATIVLRSREMTDVTAAATSGIGIALLPCMLGDATPGLRRATPAVLLVRPLFLVYRREMRLAAEVRAVQQFVVDVMRRHRDLIGGTAAAVSTG
jgi:DNA-binding transcriptional LysR family regulator